MHKNNLWKLVLSFTTLLLVVISATLLVFSLTNREKLLGSRDPILLLIPAIAIFINFVVLLLERFIRYRRDYEEIVNKDIAKLNKIMQYDRQRKEIEEEIQKLTQQLVKSEVSQYIDINRLAFSGQNSEPTLELSAGCSSFLKQFGINDASAKPKEGSAVFLTPFTPEGDELFAKCHTILAKANIFLQRTDNLVEKDDILMNIVTMIVQSELVVVNLEGRNPNVYYELGICHALGKPTILLSNANYSLQDIGFDIRQKRIIIYEDDDKLETELLYQISRLKRF